VDTWVFERLSGEDALAAARRGGARSSGSAVSQPATGASRDLPALDLPDDLDQLRELAMACTRCGLAKERTQVVFSDGNPAAQVAVVGEAPGANEDRIGLPFVGAAGKLLDLLLATVDLSREESVYICNVIKCRPPGNRNPLPDEIACCAPYLRKQIELVRPRVILAVGNFAAQLLVGRSEPLGKLRGRVYAYDGTPLIVTYHPAALLRSPAWTRPTWEDLQLLRRVLDKA
jgi:DNA polymerase